MHEGNYMIQKLKSWHAGLSKGGRLGLWLSLLCVGFFGLASANPTPQTANSTTQPIAAQQEAKPDVEVKEESEVIPIAYAKTTQNDSSLEKGKTRIITPGVDGAKTVIYSVTYTDGKQTNKVVSSEAVTKPAVAEVTAIGTYVAAAIAPAPSNNCDPNYRPCVPRVSYDLDCKDIGMQVTVIGSDPHNFDGDGDGAGCESY
jgi:resuscitation-promoting factor RpfB